MYLSIASFALAAAGLAVRFLAPAGPAQHLIVAVLIFLVLSSGLQWHEESTRTRQVREVADEIISVTRNERLTIEDIIARLRKPDYSLAIAAIDLLIAEKRLGSVATTIIDKPATPIPIRLYYVRSP